MSENPPVKSLKDFVLGAADQLERKVIDMLAPLYEPGEKSSFTDIIRDLCTGHGKTPFSAQMDSICAALKGFRSGLRCVSLVAEMGCGKTLLGCFISYALSVILKRPTRTLVLCPPTLLSTWRKELKAIFGNKVRIVSANGQEAIYLLTKARAERTSPDKPEFWIMGFNRAKIGSTWEHAGIFEAKHTIEDGKEEDGNTRYKRMTRSFCSKCCSRIDWDAFRHNKRNFCKCGNALWGPDGRRRMYPPVLYIKKYLKNYFDILIADEMHKLKGGDTIQGAMFGQLASSCRYTLPLTGTLSGGKASEIFYLIQRALALNFSKEIRKKILPGFNEKQDFIGQFGCLEEVYTHKPGDHLTGRASSDTEKVVEKPGISPMILKQFFLASTVFLRISDIADQMPAYDEVLEFCDMPPVLHSEYKKFETELTDAAKQALANKDMTVLGKMLSTLLAWPDVPKEIAITNGLGYVVASAPEIDIETGKFERLVEILEENREAGRKVLIFCEYTGKWATDTILAEKLRGKGFNPLVMKANTVTTDKRLDWIESKMEKGGYDCMICQPQLVEVGLNLLMFPEIVFYQTGYSTYVLRQAARRSWRPSQTEDVCVRFLINRDSLQEKAMTLIASKFEASLVLEGELSDKGLVALSDMGDGMATELARALVKDLKMDSLEKAFASYRAQDSKIFGSKSKSKAVVEKKQEQSEPNPILPNVPPTEEGKQAERREAFHKVGELRRMAGMLEASGTLGRRRITVKIDHSVVIINGTPYKLKAVPSLPGFEAWDVIEAA